MKAIIHVLSVLSCIMQLQPVLAAPQDTTPTPTITLTTSSTVSFSNSFTVGIPPDATSQPCTSNVGICTQVSKYCQLDITSSTAASTGTCVDPYTTWVLSKLINNDHKYLQSTVTLDLPTTPPAITTTVITTMGFSDFSSDKYTTTMTLAPIIWMQPTAWSTTISTTSTTSPALSKRGGSIITTRLVDGTSFMPPPGPTFASTVLSTATVIVTPVPKSSTVSWSHSYSTSASSTITSTGGAVSARVVAMSFTALITIVLVVILCLW